MSGQYSTHDSRARTVGDFFRCAALVKPFKELGPKGDEVLPSIAKTRRAKNYLLYPAYADNAYVIHVPLPNHYMHESNTTDPVSKSYSMSVSMYYPQLNGKFHPDNAKRPECDGYCGGYVRALIKPNPNTARASNARMLSRIAHRSEQDGQLSKAERLDPEFGIEEHFQIRNLSPDTNAKTTAASTKEYFIVRSKSGEAEYLFECAPRTPSPACRVKFNLSARPELVVDIRFSRDLMSEWKSIIRSVDAKIASWGPTRIETQINQA